MDYGDRKATNLIPPRLLAEMPGLYSQESESDPLVVAKFFTPDAGATWFVLEGAKTEDDDVCFFGYVYLGPHMADCAELGYFQLSELEALRGHLGLPVERDLYWTPKPLSEAKAGIGR